MKPSSALTLLLAATSYSAHAMQPLNDSELSGIAGQDGIVLDIQTDATGITADRLQLSLEPDHGAFPDLGNSQANLIFDNIGITNVNEQGVVGGNAHVKSTIDIGSDGTAPYLSYLLEIFGQPDGDGGNRVRLALGEMKHDDNHGYGTFALDGEGQIHLVNRGGLLNSNATDGRLFGILNNGRLYYRQLDAGHAGASTLLMENLHAKWDIGSFPGNSTVGINSEGIIMSADEMSLALDMDFFHKPGGEFTPGGRGLQHLGWLGNPRDMELLWRTKGADGGAETPGALNMSAKWNYANSSTGSNYDDQFRWRLGETGGTATPGPGDTRVMFEAADWATWGDHSHGLDFPIVAMDVIDNGRVAPGSYELCWGGPQSGTCTGETVNLLPGHVGIDNNRRGIAIMVRDGNLQSYSRSINLLVQDWNAGEARYDTRLLDPNNYPYADNDVSHAIDWGLIYTFANIDGNISLYPGGNPDDLSKGIMADIFLTSQSFDPTNPDEHGFNWDHGSHLMIADTNMDGSGVGQQRNAMGIGLMSTSFLVMADDTRLWLKPYDMDGAQIADYYSGGIDLFSPRVRFALNTTFGGGVLPDDNGNYGVGPRFVKGAVISGNLEGAVNMRLSPSAPDSTAGDNYLGYSWAIRLMPLTDADGTEGFGSLGNYISFAEPSNTDVALRLANITGDISMTNGKVDVRAEDEDNDGRPKLVISHDMQLGAAAAGRMPTEMPAFTPGLGPEVRVNNMMLGDANLGRMLIPSAQIHARLTLEPQQAGTP